MNVKNVVKVMNFHALVRVDASKRRAVKYQMLDQELLDMLDQIMNNRNLVLDKSILKPDPSRPSLTFYIGSDFGFCSNYNSMINNAIKEDPGMKVLVGKKLRGTGGDVLKRYLRDEFEEGLWEVEELLRSAVVDGAYSSIHVVYHRYINTTESRFEKVQLYPVDVPRKQEKGFYKEDFIIEGDLSNMLQELLLTYIVYELELASISGYATENIMRQNTTQESLDKIAEREEEALMASRRERREEEFKKVIESYSKMKSR